MERLTRRCERFGAKASQVAVLVDTNVICDVLYNELCYQATSPDDVNDSMERMGLVCADLPKARLICP